MDYQQQHIIIVIDIVIVIVIVIVTVSVIVIIIVIVTVIVIIIITCFLWDFNIGTHTFHKTLQGDFIDDWHLNVSQNVSPLF